MACCTSSWSFEPSKGPGCLRCRRRHDPTAHARWKALLMPQARVLSIPDISDCSRTLQGPIAIFFARKSIRKMEVGSIVNKSSSAQSYNHLAAVIKNRRCQWWDENCASIKSPASPACPLDGLGPPLALSRRPLRMLVEGSSRSTRQTSPAWFQTGISSRATTRVAACVF